MISPSTLKFEDGTEEEEEEEEDEPLPLCLVTPFLVADVLLFQVVFRKACLRSDRAMEMLEGG